MKKLPENDWVVKIRPEDWFVRYPTSLSTEAREVLLCINCFIEFSKRSDQERYWKEIKFSTLKELTEFNSALLLRAIQELLRLEIFIKKSDQKSRCILTLAQRER